MKRRSFLGSIAAALGFGAAVPAVAEEPEWEAASGAILDDLKAIEKATSAEQFDDGFSIIAGEFIPANAFICIGDDGKAYAMKIMGKPVVMEIQ